MIGAGAGAKGGDERVSEDALLAWDEAGGDAAPEDPPFGAAHFVVFMGDLFFEEAPGLGDAPIVESDAAAWAEGEPGQAEPAGFVLDAAGAGLVEVEEDFPEAAEERGRPFEAGQGELLFDGFDELFWGQGGSGGGEGAAEKKIACEE